jgi:hypothetical protein
MPTWTTPSSLLVHQDLLILSSIYALYYHPSPDGCQAREIIPSPMSSGLACPRDLLRTRRVLVLLLGNRKDARLISRPTHLSEVLT